MEFAATSAICVLNIRGGGALSSRVGCPITGGHFVTWLAKSYGVFILGLTRMLTCIKGNDLPLSYLELMNVIVNMGGFYGI